MSGPLAYVVRSLVDYVKLNHKNRYGLREQANIAYTTWAPTTDTTEYITSTVATVHIQMAITKTDVTVIKGTDVSTSWITSTTPIYYIPSSPAPTVVPGDRYGSGWMHACPAAKAPTALPTYASTFSDGYNYGVIVLPSRFTPCVTNSQGVDVAAAQNVPVHCNFSAEPRHIVSASTSILTGSSGAVNDRFVFGSTVQASNVFSPKGSTKKIIYQLDVAGKLYPFDGNYLGCTAYSYGASLYIKVQLPPSYL
ncbi:hypothetical protein PT974_05394 [Cladobotryum mycophilum]|uniref:Uncharacterized protein n=1 Tax=Cladobotryum mycophilum TaxID=491253 RepID=A0ABR0SIN8_9HYPO